MKKSNYTMNGFVKGCLFSVLFSTAYNYSGFYFYMAILGMLAVTFFLFMQYRKETKK